MTATRTLNPAPRPVRARDADYDRFRATAYGLLGALFARPPSATLLGWLCGLELSPAEDAPMYEAWSQLQRAARQARAEEVADEYQDLFVGLGKGEIVPYASWYKTGFLMEAPLVGLRRDLRALGIERQEAVREPEDHVAALCEVMAMLVDPANGYEADQQRQFFDAHLRDWHERFFTDLHGCRSARFYRAVGSFGGAFLNLEVLYLEA